jgi:hypothetical protein
MHFSSSQVTMHNARRIIAGTGFFGETGGAAAQPLNSNRPPEQGQGGTGQKNFPRIFRRRFWGAVFNGAHTVLFRFGCVERKGLFCSQTGVFAGFVSK